jgi:hypothetical protein
MKFACRAAAPVIAAAAALFCLAAKVEAAPIVVFSDNFEDTTVVPGLPNAPQAGSYPTATAIDPESQVVAAGQAYPSSPGTGVNILRIASNLRNYGTWSTAATTGDTVRYEFDAYATNPAGATFSFGLMGNNSPTMLDGLTIPIWIQIPVADTIQAYNASGGWQNIAGIASTHNAWQHYAVEYVVGETDFEVTAGTTTVTSSRLTTSTLPTQITHVIVHGGSTSSLSYVDNIVVTVTPVPEPASLALLAGGAGLLLARRRNGGWA